MRCTDGAAHRATIRHGISAQTYSTAALAARGVECLRWWRQIEAIITTNTPTPIATTAHMTATRMALHRRHHLVHVRHDPERAQNDEADDQQAERQGQHVVDLA